MESRTIAEIQKVLPHRYPFLLVDRVLEIRRGADLTSKVGCRVHAIKNVTIGEGFFQGHFPHQPIMPGVLILEAMAQAGALAYFDPNEPPSDVAIAAVHSAKFRRPVIPGDRLELLVEIIRDRKNMVVIKCEAVVDSQKVAEAEIMAYVSSRGVLF